MKLVSDFSENNNLFNYLEECGLRQDAEECFQIEVEKNGLPDTLHVRNAYLYTLQAALKMVEGEANMHALTDLAQDVSLRAAYVLADLNNPQLDTYDPKLCVSDDAIAAAIVETHFFGKHDDTDMMDVIGYEGRLLLEKHKSMGENPHYYHDTYMGEARTLHLACKLKDMQNMMIGLVAMEQGIAPPQTAIPLHQFAKAQVQNVDNLELSGKNHLEQRILETAEFMTELSNSTLSQQRKSQLSVVPTHPAPDNE